MQTQQVQEPEFHHVITVEETGGLTRKINIMYDAQGVKGALDDATKAVGKQVQIKGFRKGRAPLALVKNHCKKQIELTAKSMLSQKGYMHACNEHKLFVLKEPEFDDPEFNTDGTFTCQINVEIRPTIEPTGYIGLKLEKSAIEREPLFTQFMEEIRQHHVSDVQVDEVKDKSMATVDFRVLVKPDSFKQDNHPVHIVVNEGAAQPFYIAVGQEVPFGENLIGMKVGETKTETITLPKEYKDYGGKEARVEIILKSVVEKVLPTDEELVERTESPSYDELVEVINKRVERDAVTREMRALQELAIDKLLDMHTFETPQDWIESEIKHVLGQLHMTKAPDDEETMKVIRDMAERNVKRTFMLDSVYDNEPSLKVSVEDIQTLIEEEAKANNVSTTIVKKEWSEKSLMDGVVAFIKHRKVLDFIIAGAQIEEKNVDNAKDSQPVQPLEVPENPMDTVETE